jgi:hypothetical protein
MQIKLTYQKIFTPDNNELIIFFYLLFIAVGLPLSSVFMSIGGIGLCFHWVVSGRYTEKISRFKDCKILWPIILLFLLHLIWLLNTTNFQYAFHDIKIKLPILVIPFVLGTCETLSVTKYQYLFKAFVFGVFASSVVSVAIYLGLYKRPVNDIRDISIFISHIRLGLMVVFSIIILLYFYSKNREQWPLWRKVTTLLLTGWFLLFIIILQSTTSWVIIIVLFYFLFFRYYPSIKEFWMRLCAIILLIILPIIIAVMAFEVYNDFYTIKDDIKNLPKLTKQGNKYRNDTANKMVENGHYVNILVSVKELSACWPKMSKIPFYSYDAKGQPIHGTIIRYLASKGFSRDREGLMALTKADIDMIEQGYASCVYLDKSILYLKLYETLWEFDRYLNHDDPNAKSICMRFEYLKAGGHIIKDNFWFGVGTGDLNESFKEAYVANHSKLFEEYRKRAHDQYVTFFISFGCIGFLLVLFTFFAPVALLKKRSILLISFAIIIFLSMLNEDTLETQAGATFFAFFYTTLLIYSSNKDHDV